MWSPEGWKHGTECVLGGDCSTSALLLKSTRSLSWKCLQHIQLILLRVAAKGRWKAPRHSKENVTFLSDVLICWCTWLKENKTAGKLDFFLLFFYSCAVHIETRYLELALSQHLLLDAGQTGPIIVQIPAAFVQIFSSQQQTPALTLNLDSQPSACSPASAKPTWGCQLCPTKAGNFPTPHGNFCREICIFFPCLFGFEGKWDLIVVMEWHKKSFCSGGLQLPLVSWVFLGSWWEALGMWQRWDQGENNPWVHPWPDRQTYTLHCVYINVSLPKYQAFSYKWGKHASISEDLVNAGKQCIPINELVLPLTLLPDLFNILFLLFFQHWNIYIYSLQPLKSFWGGKKGLAWMFAASPSQVFTDLEGRKKSPFKHTHHTHT